jgi:hypothetical protein
MLLLARLLGQVRQRICALETGEDTEVEQFVAVVRASNYAFMEATPWQMVPDFCARVRGLGYLEAALASRLRRLACAWPGAGSSRIHAIVFSSRSPSSTTPSPR